MLNMIKLYYRYIFSKKIIVVFVIINLVYLASLVYSSGVLDGYSYIDMYRNEFFDVFYSDFILVVKVLSVIFNVFMVSLIFKDSCINMSKYVVDKSIKKLYLVWAKILIATIIFTCTQETKRRFWKL